jgi:hypothetical protein
MSARPKPTEPGSNLVVVDRAAAAPATIATIEGLQAAVQRGEITAKFAREALVRLIAPAKPPMARVALPPVVDAPSYAAASQLVLQATAEGRFTANDGLALLRLCKTTLEAHRLAERTRR